MQGMSASPDSCTGSLSSIGLTGGHNQGTAAEVSEGIDGFHGAFYHENWRALHHDAAC